MKKIALILVVLASGLLFSCKKNDVKVTIEVNPEELVFTSEQGAKTVEVTCNSNWEARIVASTWAALEMDGTTLIVSVLSNPGPGAREATLNVSSGDVTKSVKITQQAAE
ncbi:MAG: BACON domain-containing protein [Bacteroidales bacterium]|nr:BACON domain-containing protein [Bacteroidales bacterium]